MSGTPRELPIVIREENGVPFVELAGQEITAALAHDGVSIEYVDLFPPTVSGGGGPSVPQVTLRFAPGALKLDFGVDLLRQLLADASA